VRRFILTRPSLVIVSSYSITAGNFQEGHQGVFSKVRFHRVILDEAHTIKNKATRAAIGW
jgi:SNF2 family DNA or RNA helicase